MPSSLTVSRGGVRIHKAVVEEESPLPTVVYVVSSERDEPVAVRVLDEVPEGVPPGAVAVHDAYDAGGWRIDGEGFLEYSRELAPGETRETAIFVRVDGATAREFLVAPSIEDVRPTTLVGAGAP